MNVVVEDDEEGGGVGAQFAGRKRMVGQGAAVKPREMALARRVPHSRIRPMLES